jgi:putative ABC transport system substrate-binding protein
MLNKKNSRKLWAMSVWAVAIALLLSGCAGTPTPKVYRIGILSSPSFVAINDGFKAKMTELGYIENQNIIYSLMTTGSDMTEVQGQAKKLVNDNVDLIFTSGTPNALTAQAAAQGTNISVVFAYGQLEGTNLVKSVREPGGNTTGVRYPGPEMISKRLEILHEMAPNVKRVWIGYNKNGPNTATALEALRPKALSMGITLVELPATKMDELGADLAARGQAADIGLDAIITMPDEFNTTAANFTIISKFAAEHNLPLAGGIAYMADQGALFVNTTDLANVGRLAAPIANKILKGTSAAGTIPVVTPEQTLTINYKVGQGLGIVVPEGLLKQATKIIR